MKPEANFSAFSAVATYGATIGECPHTPGQFLLHWK
jgi:hypothetical protein